MVGYLLTIFLEPQRNDQQYGFRPGRGIAGAWEWILGAVIPSETIWEFDLRSFFNSVRLGFV